MNIGWRVVLCIMTSGVEWKAGVSAVTNVFLMWRVIDAVRRFVTSGESSQRWSELSIAGCAGGSV